jgi:hypothetical protein
VNAIFWPVDDRAVVRALTFDDAEVGEQATHSEGDVRVFGLVSKTCLEWSGP